MSYTIKSSDESRSFPQGDAFLVDAAADGDIMLLLGPAAGKQLADVRNPERYKAVLVELGTECLGVYTGENRGEEGSNVLGFARYRQGDAKPTRLVELVHQPNSEAEAIEAARALFKGAELEVAICTDVPGRIVDRMVRPYYNEVLRRLDEKLATADDMDLTLRLGLGYPEGPIDLLERTGLEYHYDVSRDLYEATGNPAYSPARRAQVAKQRRRDQECSR
ncbi:3-hydroxyacyl-CoA dehydrogenase family protein [Halomonas sp. HK25]|uniref:3-hydroxyacyl-CoA dehydrogenase family protein n=1 Tax=Halomonas sp. HK25 TaxID=3394321 RepID=UPI0039FC411C